MGIRAYYTKIREEKIAKFKIKFDKKNYTEFNNFLENEIWIGDYVDISLDKSFVLIEEIISHSYKNSNDDKGQNYDLAKLAINGSISWNGEFHISYIDHVNLKKIYNTLSYLNLHNRKIFFDSFKVCYQKLYSRKDYLENVNVLLNDHSIDWEFNYKKMELRREMRLEEMKKRKLNPVKKDITSFLSGFKINKSDYEKFKDEEKYHFEYYLTYFEFLGKIVNENRKSWVLVNIA